MAKPVTLGPGVQYVLTGVAYEILDVLNDGNILVQTLMPPQQKSIHPAKVLRQYWRAGTLRFALPGEANVRNEKALPFKIAYEFADLHGLPRSLALETWHRYRLIHPLLKLTARERTEEVLQERIETYKQELLAELREMVGRGEPIVLLGQHIGKGGGSKKGSQASAEDKSAHLPRARRNESEQDDRETQEKSPATFASSEDRNEATGSGTPGGSTSQIIPFPLSITRRTVQRWIRRFQQGGNDIRCLAPSYHRNGPQELYMAPEVQEALKQAIYIGSSAGLMLRSYNLHS